MGNSNHKNKALFLDRDGVINKAMPRKVYLTRPEQFEFMPEIIPVAQRAKELGYKVIVVTNQGQINRGELTHKGLAEIHARMHSLMPGLIDVVYYCPHTADEDCECRKPKPGMLLKAAAEHNIDLSKSIMLGDGDNDILAGQAAGCKTIFITNEHRGQEVNGLNPDFVVSDLLDIVQLLENE